MDIDEVTEQLLSSAISDCRCGRYESPRLCEYHEGMADGIEMALRHAASVEGGCKGGGCCREEARGGASSDSDNHPTLFPADYFRCGRLT